MQKLLIMWNHLVAHYFRRVAWAVFVQVEKNKSDVTNEAVDDDEYNDGGKKKTWNHTDETFKKKKVLIVKISKMSDSIFFSFFCSPSTPLPFQALDCISIAFGVHSPGA